MSDAPAPSRWRAWLLAAAVADVALFRLSDVPAADVKRVVLLVTALVALAFTLRRIRVVSMHSAQLLALAFVGFSLASSLWGLPAGRLDVAPWIAGAAIAGCAASLGRGEALRTLRGAALGAGTASSLFTLFAYARGHRGFELHGLQGNPNWLGLLLAVTIPFAIDALYTCIEERRRVAALVLAVLVVQLVALGLAHARVAWLATLVAAGFLLARRRGPLVLGALLLLAAPLAFAATGELPDDIRDAPADVALSGRLWIARVSLRAAWHALPLGTGAGGFAHAFLGAQGELLAALDPAVASRRFVNATTAHGDFLQALVETGPLGLLLLAGAIFQALRAKADRAVTAALLALAITMVGDSPLRQPAIVPLVALAFATLPVPSNASRLDKSPLALAIGAMLLLAWLTPGAVRCGSSARLRSRAEAEPLHRRALLERSVAIDPTSGESVLALGLAELDAGAAKRALTTLAHARVLLANVGTDVAIGNAHARLGEHDAAIFAYRRALAQNPGQLRARVNLAELLRLEGRLAEARSEFVIAKRCWPFHAAVRELDERLREDRVDDDAAHSPFSAPPH